MSFSTRRNSSESMSGTFRRWEIVETELFAAQRDKLEADVRRMDELLDSYMWGLAENPGQGFQIPDRNLWMLKTDPFPSAPAVRIWYTFDAEEVRLLSIEQIREDE
jgi:hypothetical protein